MKFKEYSKKQIHFIDLEIPEILENFLKSYSKSFRILQKSYEGIIKR